MKTNMKYQISESEELIMDCLQQGGAMPLSEINKRIRVKRDWSDSTIKTFVRRLCAKGALIAEKREVFYYKPAYSMEERNHHMLKELVDNAFGGSLQKLMLNYLGNEPVDTAELQELDQMLKEYQKNPKKK